MTEQGRRLSGRRFFLNKAILEEEFLANAI